MSTLEKLQNGTDIRGIALDNEGFNLTLTEEAVENIAIGFSKWLYKKNKTKISVALGKDSRLTGDLLKKSAISGLTKMGVDVVDCNMATTPAMFMSTILDGYKVTGSIMLTASHMPKQYNGMKFFTNQGGLEKEDLKEVIALATGIDKEYELGNVENKDLISDYSNVLVEKIRQATAKERPLEGLKIIVDAGNGAGGFFAHDVLEALGADTKGSQFLDADGNFPNHIPNPENKEAMKSISDAVIKSKADLGIIFDTDVDRAAVVDKDGREINKNSLIAVISAIILEEVPGTTIVTDSITSEGLKEFIESLGGKHHRFKRGYKNVINESKRLNKIGQESDLAIETSGHAAIKENYFLDDGAYLVSKILIKLAKLNQEGKVLSSIIENFKESFEEDEFRLNIKTEDFRAYGNNILEKFRKKAEESEELVICSPNYEGIKVYVKNTKSWFLIRVSLHEPILVINLETDRAGMQKNITDMLKNILTEFSALSLRVLEEHE
ncbi:phosphomannomutase/phosphoglucomutase [uncultured Clostridium sp.]|jgi:phosphomannomutase|uniref:phosphomannomutase/phosphoglucomutase n=1 Tax=uncultured Clostridium sp. TaxID=59620 RepID=UPI002632E566|nr:phosphomannomutase/phosphoglucomutase [uncultured Clostridium sp.]